MSGSSKVRGSIQAGILALGCLVSINMASAETLQNARPQVLMEDMRLLADGADAAADEQALLAKEAELLRKVEENRGEPAASPESAAGDAGSANAAASNEPPAAADSTQVAAENSGEAKIEKITLPNPSEQDIAAAEGAIEPAGRGKKAAKNSAAQTAEIQGRLDRAQQKINGLVAELDQTRNRLMLAETEVERLNAIIEDRNRSKLESYSSRNGTPNTQPPVRRNSIRPEALPSANGKISEDMPIATVVVDKAHLRTGPGLNNSPLMTVSVGTRLAVETRMGDWYRIISPTGTRAWVASDVVAFGLDGKPDPSKTVKVKGYDSRLEDKGFDLRRKPAPETDE